MSGWVDFNGCKKIDETEIWVEASGNDIAGSNFILQLMPVPEKCKEVKARTDKREMPNLLYDSYTRQSFHFGGIGKEVWRV